MSDPMFSANRRCVLDAAVFLSLKFGSYTLHEVARRVIHLEPEQIRSHLSTMKNWGLILKLDKKRVCRETDIQSFAYRAVSDAQQKLEDRCREIRERISATAMKHLPETYAEHYEPKPSRPTRALPGSPEKLEILRQRFERGEDITNDRDSDYGGAPYGDSSAR